MASNIETKLGTRMGKSLPGMIRAATTAFEAGRFEEASASCRRFLDEYPDQPMLLNIRAGCALHRRDLAEAIALYQKTLLHAPDFPMAWCNFGLALTRAGQYPEACEALRRAIRLRFDLPEAWSNLGDVQMRMGRRRAARRCFELAVRHRPDDPQHHYLLAAICRKLRLDKKALVAYRDAVRLAPDNLRYRTALANHLAACRLDFDDPALRDDLRLCLRGEGIDPNRLRHATMQVLIAASHQRRMMASARHGR